uniref:Crp/Fnr family transcriptional regulator n=1 Tax=Pseudomonas fluorescens TaxID=294 RepID=UPI0018660765|nr:Crp/Fnr family transcriptional regulator [Pseudomonas fluorescens]
MVNTRFAGSNGLLDVPAPLWIADDEQLFGHWGSLLLTIIKHGSVETLRRGDSLEFAPREFGLMIDGGLYVTDQPESKEPRTLLIQFLRRGDIFSSAIGGNLHLQLQAHCRTTCLIIREPVLEAFQCEFPFWDRMLPKLTAGMAQAYSRAVCDTMGRDQDRIHRVLTILANHPTAIDSKLGREIEANKQQIRDLAGVQKRSATRAFRALEESSAVSFYGYKRLFFRGVNSE